MKTFKINMVSAFVSTCLGLSWVMLIHRPQESKGIYVLWTVIYFFPFFFACPIIVDFFLTYIIINNRVLNFLMGKWLLVITSIVLCLLIGISCYNHFHNITLFSFIINTCTITFSVLVFLRIKRMLIRKNS